MTHKSLHILKDTMKFTEQVQALVIVTAVLSQSRIGYSQHREVIQKKIQGATCNSSGECPTWFICTSQSSCKCGNTHNDITVCDKKKMISAVLDCNCVTYDDDTESTFAGKCFYNCGNYYSKKNYLVYNTLPEKPETLSNQSVCENFHRTGLLCGECKDG